MTAQSSPEEGDTFGSGTVSTLAAGFVTARSGDSARGAATAAFGVSWPSSLRGLGVSKAGVAAAVAVDTGCTAAGTPAEAGADGASGAGLGADPSVLPADSAALVAGARRLPRSCGRGSG